ncbi:DUF3152 domain-containing protein [Demequina sp. TTPB684]|uniref:DUF3152 domain-containing protein n=1 Tax=unclassified Demequina TaxID=2620311 RepID=UPI001CF2CF4F|nr:DUF3152 domain-containing protein [Demequina sp. TMPB413]MCB2412062.1 DUF3152 domain-containing protein [Demequina sp. TTPB684]UPU88517.1 DUF3152 domain-containing protein [Demequina sp. TMPB413]
MISRLTSVFAGRGISLPGLAVTAGVVLGAFALGLAAGWITDGLPQRLRAEDTPTASPSPTPDAGPTIEPSLPPLEPITRQLDDADREAGVVTTSYVVQGEGTFTVVPGTDTPDADGGDVRWVSVAVEDGVSADDEAFRDYVLDVLNDNRAWGTDGSLQFVATDGVADYRVLLASPYTTAAVCPDPHIAVTVGPVTNASPTPSPDAEADVAPGASGEAVNGVDGPTPDAETDRLCAEDGVIVLSMYDWTAGLPAYGDDFTGARNYLLLHRLGHLMGREDTACATGRATTMDLQRDDFPEGCEVNPWPYPDAPATLPTPSPSPTAAKVSP